MVEPTFSLMREHLHFIVVKMAILSALCIRHTHTQNDISDAPKRVNLVGAKKTDNARERKKTHKKPTLVKDNELRKPKYKEENWSLQVWCVHRSLHHFRGLLYSAHNFSSYY